MYATCSLLAEENESQIDKFLYENKDFKESVDWFSGFGLDANKVSVESSYLRTYAAKTETDGFFVSVLERKSQ